MIDAGPHVGPGPAQALAPATGPAVDAESTLDVQPSGCSNMSSCSNLGDTSLNGMQVQKKRSKDSSKQVDLTAADAVRQQLQSVGITRFQGYEDVQGAGAVVAILKDGNMIETAQEGRHSPDDWQKLLPVACVSFMQEVCRRAFKNIGLYQV